MISSMVCDINKLLRGIRTRVSSINQNPHADSSTQKVWKIMDKLFLFDVNELKENFYWTHRLA